MFLNRDEGEGEGEGWESMNIKPTEQEAKITDITDIKYYRYNRKKEHKYNTTTWKTVGEGATTRKKDTGQIKRRSHNRKAIDKTRQDKTGEMLTFLRTALSSGDCWSGAGHEKVAVQDNTKAWAKAKATANT